MRGATPQPARSSFFLLFFFSFADLPLTRVPSSRPSDTSTLSRRLCQLFFFSFLFSFHSLISLSHASLFLARLTPQLCHVTFANSFVFFFSFFFSFSDLLLTRTSFRPSDTSPLSRRLRHTTCRPFLTRHLFVTCRLAFNMCHCLRHTSHRRLAPSSRRLISRVTSTCHPSVR